MNHYETVFILNPVLSEAQIKEAVEKFEFKAPGEVIEVLELEFKRDERVMRYLTVKLDKDAIAWAEKRRAKLNTKKA